MHRAIDCSISPRVRDLIPPAGGHGMFREFYSDEEVYQVDCQQIWRTGWIFAGHSCEIPKPGDYFTLEVDNDSIIVTRDGMAMTRALSQCLPPSRFHHLR